MLFPPKHQLFLNNYPIFLLHLGQIKISSSSSSSHIFFHLPQDSRLLQLGSLLSLSPPPSFFLLKLPFPSAANDLIALGFVWFECIFLFSLLHSCDLLNYKQEANYRIMRGGGILVLLNARMSSLITGSQVSDSSTEYLHSFCIKIRGVNSIFFFLISYSLGMGRWGSSRSFKQPQKKEWLMRFWIEIINPSC